MELMEADIEWDDSRDKIMDIVEGIEDNKELKVPMKCPICNTNHAHIYMHCWENADFINISELTSHPVFLERKADMVDQHIRQLLKNLL